MLLAAGDIGDCATQGDEATAGLLAEHPEATIAVLGDVAYPHGTAEDFERCFAPSWGRFRDRMRPATGNHEHATPKARGYARYFGARGGPPGSYRYSYELGAWHVVVLDSDCWRVGGCDLDDPQARWMRADLRSHRRRCTMAYWHRPPFSSGRYGDPADTERVRALWQVAVREGVDVVLTAHEHSYERHAPMDADGARDPGGTRLFIVGTGGGNLRRVPRSPAAHHRGPQRRHVGPPATRPATRRLRLAVHPGGGADVHGSRIRHLSVRSLDLRGAGARRTARITRPTHRKDCADAVSK